jgi:tRNA-2-methylthio-N6-dimethylallyladenosine synthase
MIKFFIENYGCQMNSSETDSLRSIFFDHGFIEVADPPLADIAVINTCSIRKTAEDRIEGRLGYYRGLRDKKGSKVRVVFMGCMAQNRGKEIGEKYSDVVAAVWGTYNKGGVAELIDSLKDPGNNNAFSLAQESYEFMKSSPRERLKFKSFVQISHGCNNFCSYCIVPMVRGREVYRKSGEIIDNISSLVDGGVLEVTLLGQNVNSYSDSGLDFPGLLDKISTVTGIKRLTFLTSHPKDLSKNLTEVIRAHDNILKTVHLPLQSANDRILKLMNRKYTFDQYLEKISWIKEIKDVTISTDIITGFPSESGEEFQDTLDAMKNIMFDEAFMYYYNPRPGTPASSITPQLGMAAKKHRLAELISVQQKIMSERLASFTGFRTSVLMESPSRKDPGELIGRTHNGLMVFMKGDKSLAGKIMNVEILKPSGTGLKAKIL